MGAQDAKQRFVTYTNGTGDINVLYGPVNAPRRASILEDLTEQFVPRSRAGWRKFRKAILELYGVTGECMAEEDCNLRDAVLRESRRNNEAFCDALQPTDA